VHIVTYTYTKRSQVAVSSIVTKALVVVLQREVSKVQ
jgi:hypothetical protein